MIPDDFVSQQFFDNYTAETLFNQIWEHAQDEADSLMAQGVDKNTAVEYAVEAVEKEFAGITKEVAERLKRFFH